MENNTNEPGPLHRLILMAPPSGNMPNMQGPKTVTGDIRRQGEMKLGNENWIGHATRVASEVRAANEARVGNAPRVADTVRAGHAVTTRYGNQECGHPSGDGARARGAPACQPPSTSSHSYKQTRSGGRATHPAPSREELSKFLKLKEEVTKWPQGYIQGCAKHIARILTPNHEVVKCLMAFGENALKYAAEVLATIEWGTQHWKLQESFPVPPVPRWLRTPELIQTMTPLRGEPLLIPLGAHLEDICICSPALWAWMAVLLQYWQDHMTRHLYGGCFQQASELAGTLIRDINPWLPHRVCFGWSYMTTHATLWLDISRPICRRTPHGIGSPEVPDALSQRS